MISSKSCISQSFRLPRKFGWDNVTIYACLPQSL